MVMRRLVRVMRRRRRHGGRGHSADDGAAGQGVSGHGEVMVMGVVISLGYGLMLVVGL